MRNILVSLISGLALFLGTVFFLMELGTRQYDNYEYYGQYPALYVVPGIVGLFLPSLLAWLSSLKGKNDDH